MDFFAAQDRARRASALLVLLFALAVAGVAALVYLGVAFALSLDADRRAGPGVFWDASLFLGVAAPLAGFIVLAATVKALQLAAGGGRAVAEGLGGRLVPRAASAIEERRLVNVVEEVAIAAGLPPPPVYVLDEERGINAFAAGARPRQAVIAVTRGALEQLDRDELQGVVAHEFAHVLNGDMRLNLRLMGLVHGLLALHLMGRIMLRARGSGRGAGMVVFGGLLLTTAGWVGVLAGRLIKAAVSRQREFLADAAAVQFTRNPEGLAGALTKLLTAGSRLRNPGAEAVSHMLFDTGRHWGLGWFATHPPLTERLARLKPGLVAARVRREASRAAASGPGPALGFAEQVGRLDAEAGLAARDWLQALPGALEAPLRQAFDAQALVLALLTPAGAEAPARERLRARLGEPLAARVEHLLPAVRARGRGGRLAALDLALGTLRELDQPARRRLLEACAELAALGEELALEDYLPLRLLEDTLLPRPRPARAAGPVELREHCRVLLSLLAHLATPDPAAAFARGAARAPLLERADGLLPREALRPLGIDQALDAFGPTTPGFRRALVEALAAVALHDGEIEPAEREALRAVCEALDCPLPFVGPEAGAAYRLQVTAGR